MGMGVAERIWVHSEASSLPGPSLREVEQAGEKGAAAMSGQTELSTAHLGPGGPGFSGWSCVLGLAAEKSTPAPALPHSMSTEEGMSIRIVFCRPGFLSLPKVEEPDFLPYGSQGKVWGPPSAK